MDLKNQLQSLANLIEKNNGNITSEEATKNVLPLIAELKQLVKNSIAHDKNVTTANDLAMYSHHDMVITDEEFEKFFVVDVTQTC